MISEKNTKVIRSLLHKKYRQKYNFFIAEGRKIIIDMLKTGFNDIHQLYCTEQAYKELEGILNEFKPKTFIIHQKEFSKISNLESLPDLLLIGNIPPPLTFDQLNLREGIHVYLDQIQDPGNLGTLLRTCEWFGVKSIGRSEGCADIFHPKVIQSSMGSFWRLPYWVGSLKEQLDSNQGLHIIGADLQGTSLYDIQFPDDALLLIGSEGQGLSDDLRSLIGQYVRIPSYSGKIESLNAANAAAIILSEMKRQLSVGKIK